MLPTYRFVPDDKVMLRKSYPGAEGFLFRGVCTIIDMERDPKKRWIYHIQSEHGYTTWVEDSDLYKPEDNESINI